MQDFGAKPYVVNIVELTVANDTFRTAVWTGSNMQMTVMAIQPGDDIGAEVHDDHDQFLRIEQGAARVVMGDSADDLSFDVPAEADFAILVPAGKWHNVINTGDEPLKLYTLYGPPEHVDGAVVDVKANEKEEHFDGKTTE